MDHLWKFVCNFYECYICLKWATRQCIHLAMKKWGKKKEWTLFYNDNAMGPNHKIPNHVIFGCAIGEGKHELLEVKTSSM